jgi:hypothetical protein
MSMLISDCFHRQRGASRPFSCAVFNHDPAMVMGVPPTVGSFLLIFVGYRLGDTVVYAERSHCWHTARENNSLWLSDSPEMWLFNS